MTTEADRQHGEEVHARLAAATPRPWWHYEREFRGDLSHSIKVGEEYVLAFVGYSTRDGAVSGNADLIAHAPDDLARLLVRAEKAEATLARVRDLPRTTAGNPLTGHVRDYVDAWELDRALTDPEPTDA